MNEGGKGDKRRPTGISMEEFDNKWDAIFNSAEKEKEESPLEVEIEASRDDISIMLNLTEKF